MNGNQLYQLLTSILQENIDQTYATVLFNFARTDFEGRREWSCLKAVDSSQTALSGTNYDQAYDMPSPEVPDDSNPYLMSYLLEGGMRLVNTQNTNDILGLQEVPFENKFDYLQSNFFYGDYATRQFYILANLPHEYTIYQFFKADYGDITDDLPWQKFPSRFAPALAFQAAARYRLGTDYDDVAARNGNDNYQTSERMYQAMVAWDEKITRQAAQGRPFMGQNGSIRTNAYPGPGSWPWSGYGGVPYGGYGGY